MRGVKNPKHAPQNSVAALIEAPYNVMLEREGFRKILFVGDLIPSPLAGFGTTLEKIRRQQSTEQLRILVLHQAKQFLD